MEDASSGWCTIESDPGVFTELLQVLGTPSLQLEEIWSLDDDSLEALRATTNHVYGLIFLFQWVGEKQEEHARNKEPLSDVPPGLFFAQQVTTNACATQAILSVVLNAGLSQDDLGSTLSGVQSFLTDLPPDVAGMAVTSSEAIKEAHNSFSRQDAFLHEGKFHLPSKEDEAFHFVAYVPFRNVVYELDGLQEGPMVVGNYDEGSDWLTAARLAIQERMEAAGNVKFNLMAVIQDKRIKLREQLAVLDPGSSDYSDNVAQIAAQDAIRESWKVENQRRRHNYVPLCVQLLKELAKKGELPQLVMEAKERQAVKRMKKAENGSS